MRTCDYSPGVLKFLHYNVITDMKMLSKTLRSEYQYTQVVSANILFMDYGGITLSTYKKENTVTEAIWFEIFK
jgi:hypothetical protein